MLEKRRLGHTGMAVSCLGLGTVKIGRNQGVKYPKDFDLPDDNAVRTLLDKAKELGINLLDTAPAYGTSEERLGKLLRDRENWIICSKVGEEFQNGQSIFNFSHNLKTPLIDANLPLNIYTLSKRSSLKEFSKDLYTKRADLINFSI